MSSRCSKRALWSCRLRLAFTPVPPTIEEVADTVVARILDQLGAAESRRVSLGGARASDAARRKARLLARLGSWLMRGASSDAALSLHRSRRRAREAAGKAAALGLLAQSAFRHAVSVRAISPRPARRCADEREQGWRDRRGVRAALRHSPDPRLQLPRRRPGVGGNETRASRMASSSRSRPMARAGRVIRCNPGLVKLAQVTGGRCCRCTCDYSRCWQLKSWDGFLIPGLSPRWRSLSIFHWKFR